MTKKLNVYGAFLRGLNVGGKGIISMPVLKQYFGNLGYTDVVTYINSGNVVFTSSSVDARRLETSITKALVDHFDQEIVVVVVSADEMQALLRETKKFWPQPKDEKRNVILLRHTIDDPSIVDGLPIKKGIERLKYVPGALLWSADSSQLTKSNMIKLSSKPEYKQMTIRIVGTIEKVAALMTKVASEVQAG